MTQKRKEDIRFLLKGIETGDPASVAVVNPDKYIQHNPQTKEGGEGLAALFKRLSKTSPKVNIVRIFSDGDYVFAHTEYDFDTSRVGFEIFRFEGDQTVEHWDNIQPRKGPNASKHSMVDGALALADIECTEANRKLVKGFVEDVLIARKFDSLHGYLDSLRYIEHNPRLKDGGKALSKSLLERGANDTYNVEYVRSHRILAEGNFVLSVSEGYLSSKHTSFYDLFRIENSKIVEHWDTSETVPSRDLWENENGKF